MSKWYANLPLARKLALGFGISIGLTVVVGVSAITAFGGVRQAVGAMIAEDWDGVTELGNFDGAVRQVRLYQLHLAGHSDDTRMKEAEGEIAAATEEASRALTAYEKSLADATERDQHQKLAEGWTAYQAKWAEIVPALKSLNGEAGLDRVDSELAPLFNERIRPLLEEMRKENIAAAERRKAEVEGLIAGTTRSIFVLLGLAVLIGVAYAIQVTRSIVGPLSRVMDRMNSMKANCLRSLTSSLEAMAKGDLTHTVTPVTTPVGLETRDEVGQIAACFDETLQMVQDSIGSYNTARQALTVVVGGIVESAEMVASTSQTLAASSEESGAASTEIAHGSQTLADGASRSAAIMEQLSAQVEAVGNASAGQQLQVQEADRVLKTASGEIEGVAASAKAMEATAQEGNAAVRETVDAMARVRDQAQASSEKVQELDQRGREIGIIVRTIEGIAEQTNLLALNAAIEAARAGEHGRGFAVVAEEVRKLAEQASASTKQISDLINTVTRTVSETVVAIEATTREIAAGAARSEHAGQALDQILTAARDVADRTDSVANLTHEVGQAMRAVAAMADENARAAEEVGRGAGRVVESIAGVAAVSEEAAAGAQELSASIEEVGSAASRLAHMSESLQALVVRFRIETAPKPEVRKRAA